MFAMSSCLWETIDVGPTQPDIIFDSMENEKLDLALYQVRGNFLAAWLISMASYEYLIKIFTVVILI